MQRLEVSGAVRHIYGSLGVKRLITDTNYGILGYDTLYFGGLLPKLNTVKEADHKI